MVGHQREESAVKKYSFVVLTNPAPGKEAEYNDWYTNQHLRDLVRIPGIVAAQRYKLADKQRREPPYPHKYMAIYEVETDDLGAVIKEIGKRSGTSEMPTSTAIASGTSAFFFEPMTERVTAAKK
jgi:hypothetical protein